MSDIPRPAQTGGLKQLYLRAAYPATEIPYTPRLYVEARIDFADVRSGLSGTCSVSKALEFYPFEGDDLWTDEMVVPVAPEHVDPTPPAYARLGELPAALRDSKPEDIEPRLVTHLLRTYSVTLFRNPALNVYSRLSESRVDFCNRCLELLKGPFRLELDGLLGTFNRSLEQIRERHLKDEAWTPAFDRTRVAAQNREIFRDAADRIAYLFISTELKLQEQDPVAGRTISVSPRLQERLSSLEFEARHAVAKLVTSYRQKALELDEYIIRPKFRDIHLVRSCILWMPEVPR
jgi:hypothetical protein